MTFGKQIYYIFLNEKLFFKQPTKKKKFIDKNAGVTFHLVHRSQKDPLQADEDAAKHVLVQEQVCNVY